jgi:predicted MFS family arabinose efflux permease
MEAGNSISTTSSAAARPSEEALHLPPALHGASAADTLAEHPLREWGLLLVLATIQFTSIVDFLIVMPLGPQFQRVFGMKPHEFGLMVSSYTFSASVSGLLAVFWIDRFDRKRALLALYAGFCIGTALCALAPTYTALVAARIATGAFGGLLGAVVFAIIGDVFPEWRRGMATGMVMSAFGIASVFGVPFGLFLGNTMDWHAPFSVLAGVGLLVWLGALAVLPTMKAHLRRARPAAPFQELAAIVNSANHLRAFALIIALTIAGFTIFPYISNSLVANAGVRNEDLFWVYIVSGAVGLVVSPVTGRLSDRYGKLRLFRIMAVASILPAIAVTNLPKVGLVPAVAVVTWLVACNSGRFVPAMAMVTASVVPERRGGFMSVNASLQHLAAGIATYSAGHIIREGADGSFANYGIVGGLSVAATVLSLFLAGRLRSVDNPNPIQPKR